MPTQTNDVFSWTLVLLSVAGCSTVNGGEVTAAATAGGCPLSQPVVVASGLNQPNTLKVDDQNVYFFGHPPQAAVYRVSKEGGTAELFKVMRGFDGDAFRFDFELDASTVYIMLYGIADDDPASGGVSLLNKDGTERATINAIPPSGCSATFVDEMALGGDGSIYWLQEPGSSAPSCLAQPHEVVRVAPGTTQPIVLAPVGTQAAQLLADAFHVFWSDQDGIWRESKEGGAPELMFQAPVVAHGIAVDFNDILWTRVNPGDFQTFRIPTPRSNSALTTSLLEGIISDGTFFYGTVARNAPGAPANVLRIKSNGHGQEVLGKGAVGSVAVDETYIYYLDSTGSQILKSCKSLE